MNINTYDNSSNLIISHSMLCTSCAFANTADLTHLEPQEVQNIKKYKEAGGDNISKQVHLCTETSLQLYVE